MNKSLKIMYVGSSGGHLLELLRLKEILGELHYPAVWVTFRKPDAEHRLQGQRVYWCHYPTTRNVGNFLRNSVQAFYLLLREKPDVIVSTGAAVAVSYAWIGRLFGAKIVFVEATNRVKSPSLTGKLVYPVAHLFCVQWPKLRAAYPKAEHIGPLI